jgi:hypothetical protein
MAGSNATGHAIEFVVMQDARALFVRGDIRFHDVAPDFVSHGLASRPESDAGFICWVHPTR